MSNSTKNSERVQSWRKRTKAKLVHICGSKCRLCGYSRCLTALEFHHIDPKQKDFAVTGSGNTQRLSSLILEIRKCILVCANCHREIHAGLIEQSLIKELQFIDEDVVAHYTTEVEQAKVKFRRLRDAKLVAKRSNETKAKEKFADNRIRKVDWSLHDVNHLIAEFGSYEAVGRVLGITGAAVKRRKVYLTKRQTEGCEGSNECTPSYVGSS